jgi:hypothetical protein
MACVGENEDKAYKYLSLQHAKFSAKVTQNLNNA